MKNLNWSSVISGSTNGTFVNGKCVSHAKITAGTLLHFGRVAGEIWEGQPNPSDIGDDRTITDRSSDPDNSEIMLQIHTYSEVRKRILGLLLDGMGEKQIAAELRVNDHTVHWHIRRIYTAMS